MYISRLIIYKLSLLFFFIPIILVAEEIPVTSKFIKKGNVVNAKDIILAEADDSIELQHVIRDKEFLVGGIAVKDIEANLPIFKYQVRSQNLVTRNSVVDVFYKKGGITLQTKAIALQSGRYGSSVKLKTIDGKCNVIGIIEGRNKVNVAP